MSSSDPGQWGTAVAGSRLHVWAMDGSLVNRIMTDQAHAEASGCDKGYPYQEPVEAEVRTAQAKGTARWACPL